MRQAYMKLLLNRVVVDRDGVRLEGSIGTLERLTQNGESASLPEVLAYGREWRAVVDISENWIAVVEFLPHKVLTGPFSLIESAN